MYNDNNMYSILIIMLLLLFKNIKWAKRRRGRYRVVSVLFRKGAAPKEGAVFRKGVVRI